MNNQQKLFNCFDSFNYRTIKGIANELNISYSDAELLLHTTDGIIEAPFTNKNGDALFFPESKVKELYYELIS